MHRLVYLTALLIAIGQGQTSREIDSLQKVVQDRNTPDTTQLTAYIVLAKLYLNIEPDTALEYARKAFPLAQRVKDTRKQALTLYYQAAAFYYLNAQDRSGRLLAKAESLLSKTAADTGLKVQMLNLKALLAETQGAQVEAKAYYEKALELSQTSSSIPLRCLSLINLAEFYLHLQLYELAEEYIQQAIQLARQYKLSEYERNALKTLYLIRIRQGKLQEALAIQKEILAIARGSGIPEWIKDAYGFAITAAIQSKAFQSQADSLLLEAQAALAPHPRLWAELLNWVAAEGFSAVGALTRAKDLYQNALAIAESEKDTALAIQTLLNLAGIYTRQALYPQAMEHLLKARRMAEERNDTTLIPLIWTNLGEIYVEQEEWQKALEAFSQAANYALVARDRSLPHKIAANLAVVYAKLGQYDNARNLLHESKILAEEAEDWHSAANTYLNLARMDLDQNLLDSALTDLKEAQRYAQKSGDPYMLANVSLLRGEILLKKSAYTQAAHEYEKARQLLEPLEAYSTLAEVYDKLIYIYGQLRQYDKAYALFGPLLEATKRLSNEENARALTRMELEYQHQKENEARRRELEAEKLRAEKARQITWVIIISATLILIAAGIILWIQYQANKREKEINAELAARNRLIEEQKALLEEKNEALERAKRDIEESILYARRIQMAILPDLTPFYERFPESFVLYLPRDVVSGDFYYFHPISPYESLLAVADCTGHGVPGAFMSMIGTTLLNRIAQEEGPKDPAFLLQRLDEELALTLHQTLSQEKIKDGMDIALCLIDSQKHTLRFAGARRPLFVFTQDGEFIELKGSRRSIGGDILQREIPFESHTLTLQAHTSFYLFTDGIVDQFGWETQPDTPPRRCKFMNRRLRELLSTIRTLPAHLQKQRIEDALAAWRGDIEQIDDICIVGVRYIA